MAEWGDIKRVDLGDIEPPWRQTDIAWLAIKEGLQEIYSSNYDGLENNAIVVIPHRIQATFVCTCGTSMVVKFYSNDALKGHIAMNRRCSCGKEMKRKFIGAERDVPIEEKIVPKPKPKKGEVIQTQTTLYDDFDEDEEISEFDDDE